MFTESTLQEISARVEDLTTGRIYDWISRNPDLTREQIAQGIYGGAWREAPMRDPRSTSAKP